MNFLKKMESDQGPSKGVMDLLLKLYLEPKEKFSQAHLVYDDIKSN